MKKAASEKTKKKQGIRMTNVIDGADFRHMVEYAVKNLKKHAKKVNKLNVFPVPDGDTGTNMVTTIHRGLMNIEDTLLDLPSVSAKFARTVVYEARGNSGVIVSQFLRGFSESMSGHEKAGGAQFILALECGVESAYKSVATPVEGTMLTVLREATENAKASYKDGMSIDEIIKNFVAYAKEALERTPEQLTVLRESGVVDSGGAGVVYLFEGMEKYLSGERIEDSASDDTAEPAAVIDYDNYNENSRFEFGYCTEMLIQLLSRRHPFDEEEIKEKLLAVGGSLVLSREGSKVRVHVHTKTPEKVFCICRRYGEFLTVKVENMSVQHTEAEAAIDIIESREHGENFTVAVVSSDKKTQQLFSEMGADLSLYTEDGVSTGDYLELFERAQSKDIILFPNSSDAILSAIQAKKMWKGGRVVVINSRSIAECYASLPSIDFDSDTAHAVEAIHNTTSALYVVSVAKRESSVKVGSRSIGRSEYYSFSGKELLEIGKSLEATAVSTVAGVLAKFPREIITVFYKPHVGADVLEAIVEKVGESGSMSEVFFVEAGSLTSELTISFE